MKGETAHRISRACNDADIQKWQTGIGKFVTELRPTILDAVRRACNGCPLRNNISAGGCCGDDCPVFQMGHTVNRALPRAMGAVKEIYKQKFKRTA